MFWTPKPEEPKKPVDAKVARFAASLVEPGDRGATVDLTAAFMCEAELRAASQRVAMMAHIAAITLIAQRMEVENAVVAEACKRLIEGLDPKGKRRS